MYQPLENQRRDFSRGNLPFFRLTLFLGVGILFTAGVRAGEPAPWTQQDIQMHAETVKQLLLAKDAVDKKDRGAFHRALRKAAEAGHYRLPSMESLSVRCGGGMGAFTLPRWLPQLQAATGDHEGAIQTAQHLPNARDVVLCLLSIAYTEQNGLPARRSDTYYRIDTLKDTAKALQLVTVKSELAQSRRMGYPFKGFAFLADQAGVVQYDFSRFTRFAGPVSPNNASRTLRATLPYLSAARNPGLVSSIATLQLASNDRAGMRATLNALRRPADRVLGLIYTACSVQKTDPALADKLAADAATERARLLPIDRLNLLLPLFDPKIDTFRNWRTDERLTIADSDIASLDDLVAKATAYQSLADRWLQYNRPRQSAAASLKAASLSAQIPDPQNRRSLLQSSLNKWLMTEPLSAEEKATARTCVATLESVLPPLFQKTGESLQSQGDWLFNAQNLILLKYAAESEDRTQTLDLFIEAAGAFPKTSLRALALTGMAVRLARYDRETGKRLIEQARTVASTLQDPERRARLLHSIDLDADLIDHPEPVR